MSYGIGSIYYVEHSTSWYVPALQKTYGIRSYHVEHTRKARSAYIIRNIHSW